ncbi:MAG: hypothetical protein WC699_02690 [Bacteroidales bacterium]
MTIPVKTLTVIPILILLLVPACLFSQQVADTAYRPVIRNPAYAKGKGPVVFIDAGHHNFHTRNGRYLPFSNILESDGYQVKGYTGEFKPDQLSRGKILVIANALNVINVQDWYLPIPSAFIPTEIEVIKNWVANGGSLFLIADHMPMAGAAKDLAAVFGFDFSNGFALDTLGRGPDVFTLKDNTLIEGILTKGRDASETVDRIVSFTGQAFKIPDEATPVLKLRGSFISLMPDTAWAFKPQTPKINVGGWFQGAYRNFGRGKIVVFGEAAMFTAQLAGPGRTKTGMNSDAAPQNYQLLLNVIHWLDGKLIL